MPKAPKLNAASGSSTHSPLASGAISSRPAPSNPVSMTLSENILSNLKAALELAESGLKGIHPGVEAITGVPLKLIQFFEQVKANEEDVRELQRSIETLQSSIFDPILATCAVNPGIDLPRLLEARLSTLDTALKKLIEGLPDLERLGKFGKFKKKDKIAEAVAKAGKDLDKLVQKFIVEGHITEELILSDLKQKHENLIINSLPLARVRHSSSSKRPCIPGTRTDVLAAIRMSLDSSDLRYVFLRGSPGTGKSAITMTLAQELEREKDKKLAGSLFFDKRVTQDGSATLEMLVTSLARQISRVDPDYHKALGEALETNPDIVRDTLKIQIQQLIIAPLLIATARASTPLTQSVLVFDALDECGSPDDLNTVLDLLSALDSLPSHYRIFFSSRPQPAILRRFPFHGQGAIEDLDDAQYKVSVHEDILVFVEQQFHSLVLDDPDPSWPPTHAETQEFAGLSQGLFELAALRVRRIESAPSNGLRPRRVLDTVRNEARGLPAKRLEDELEAEYLRIIDWVYPSRGADLDVTVELYRCIVGVFVSLRAPLGLEALSRMLRMDVADIRFALRPLSSVFFVDADASIPIRCYHATFREFLLTIPPLSTKFHRKFLFDGPQHTLMLRLCVERFSQELRAGLCVETKHYDFLDEIPDFDEKVRALLPPHLRYCCLQWNHHLLSTSSDEIFDVEIALGTLLQSCLVNWVEAMSLLKETNEALSVLWRTSKWYRTWISPQGNNEQLVQEAHAMLAEFMKPIRENPRHLYHSALPQTPKIHLLRQKYLPAQNPVRVIFGDPPSSKPLYWKVECEKHEEISFAMLSPTGVNILVATHDESSHVWSLDLRRMEDGSLIRRHATTHTNCNPHHQIGMGFLSGDEDAVVSWDTNEMDSSLFRFVPHFGCFVYSLDAPPVSVAAKMGWRHNPSPGSVMTVTENTLALWDTSTPNKLCLIDAAMWTSVILTIPETAAAKSRIRLMFATDSTSLIYINEEDGLSPPHLCSTQVLVWNWTTGDLITIVPFVTSEWEWDLYLFPKSTALESFGVLLECGMSNPRVTLVPLAGAPLLHRDGITKDLSTRGPHEASQFQCPLSPEIRRNGYLPLPPHNCIAHRSEPLGHSNLVSYVIGVIGGRLKLLSIAEHEPPDEHLLLSNKADVTVRVSPTALWVGPVCRATAISSEVPPHRDISTSTISADGHLLACGYEGGLLEIYDLDSGSSIPDFSFQVGWRRCLSLAFVLDSTHIATWGERPEGAVFGDLGTTYDLCLTRLSRDLQPPTNIGYARCRFTHWGPLGPTPIMSPDASMSLEWNWETQPPFAKFEGLYSPVLTHFSPNGSYRQSLAVETGFSSCGLPGFSPNKQYVGTAITHYKNVWVWSTLSGDLIYTFGYPSDLRIGINWSSYLPHSLITSPFPALTNVASHTPDTLGHPLSPLVQVAFRRLNGDSTPMNLANTVFLLFDEERCKQDKYEYRRAQIPYAEDRFAVVENNHYIKMGKGQSVWVHPSYHRLFFRPCRVGEYPSEWMEMGGSRILLGGKDNVPLLVLDVKGLEEWK